MPTLLLVDGSSYLYRAFHALPDLRNGDGLPTGAIHGVLAMLRRLTGDYKADYLACVFDAKGKTFRDEWYPQYKANRPPMPDELAVQIAPLYEAISALGWPLVAVEGVEADDVIGTLATQATAKGIDTVVSTGDKDLAQLVSKHVTLINTMTNETLDPAGVAIKFGVAPERIVDYLALVGDAVDNVPGVDKVGPKTAVKWLAEYGTLDDIMARAGEFKGATGDSLRRALEFLPLGRKLLTVACDVDVPLAVDQLRPGQPDRDQLRTIYTRLGFKSWLRELQSGANDSDPPAAQPQGAHRAAYETILEARQLDAWLLHLESAPFISLDTETTSLDPMQARLVGISFASAAGQAAYLPLAHRYAGAPEQLPMSEAIARLKPWLESPRALKLGQNLKYDKHVFANHGIALAGVVDDTMLESYVLESDKSHDMDSLAMRHLGISTISFAEVAGKGASQIGFDQVPVERAAEYAAEDADVTLRLHEKLHAKLSTEPRLEALYRELELPVMEVLFRMERNGMALDIAQLEVQSHDLGRRMIEVESNAHRAAGQPFNIGSPKQIQEILFDREKLPVLKKTPGGAPSTDEEVLEQLALDYPLPKLILEYRALAKLKNTYTDKLPRMVNPATGRVHTNFAQAVAATGRLASNDPNLQNIPIRTAEGRRVRSAFVAPVGSKMVSADYSQIELRIMAHLSGDARLRDAFSHGEDVHRATAAEVFGVAPAEVSSDQRRYAKVINFGLIYGMSAFGLARNLGIERAAAQGFIDRYFARYPGVERYMEETRAKAREQGYVETVFGRRLYLSEIRASNQARRQGAERAAINAPMQGTAADLIKRAMISVQRWLDNERLATKLVLQVHDELVLEVPEHELARVLERLPALMESVAELTVPLKVDVGVGANWDEAH